MSQLNNENKVTLNEEAPASSFKKSHTETDSKSSFVKKLIIFTIIFAIIAVGVTVGAIIYTNNLSSDEDDPIDNTASELSVSLDNIPNKSISEDNLGITDLTEFYNMNDLKVTETDEKKGTRIPKASWDTDTNKLSLHYVSISGLKDKNLENKINNEIKTTIDSLYTEAELNDSNIDRIYIGANVDANFSNVLSVQIYKNISYVNSTDDYYYNGYGLNYNLTNGEAIKFKDLFTNASIKNSLQQLFYEVLISQYADNNETHDMSKIDLSNIEEETYSLTNKVMKDIDNINFSFSPDGIVINMPNKIYYLDTLKVHSHIAIYKKYLTSNSIFDGSYQGDKNLFVFSRGYPNSFDSRAFPFAQYENVYDNLRVEAVVYCTNTDALENSYAKTLVDEKITALKNDIEEIKKTAKDNPDNAYVYCASYDVNFYNNFDLSNLGIKNCMASVNYNLDIYEMKKTYYNDTFYEKIADFYRKPENGSFDLTYINWEDDNPNFSQKHTDSLTDDKDIIDIYTQKTKDQLLNDYYSSQNSNNIIDIPNNNDIINSDNTESNNDTIENNNSNAEANNTVNNINIEESNNTVTN